MADRIPTVEMVFQIQDVSYLRIFPHSLRRHALEFRIKIDQQQKIVESHVPI